MRVDLDNTVVGSAEGTGEAIFTTWVLPFELLSVLLLAALVGAIVLSRSTAGSSRGGPATLGSSRGHPVTNGERSGDAR